MSEKELHIGGSGSGCGLGSRSAREKMQPEPSALSATDASGDFDEPLDFSSRREDDSADAADPLERKISRDSGISVGYSNGSALATAAAALAVKRQTDCYSPAAATNGAADGQQRQHRLRGGGSSRSPSPCSLSGDSDHAGAAGAAGGRLSGSCGGSDPYMNPAALAAIPGAMFPGFPTFFAHGLHPGLAAPGHGIWPMAAAAAAAAVSPLAAAALMQDQRKFMSAAAAAAAANGNGGGSSNGTGKAAGGLGVGMNARPFKQYRDSLNMPLGYYAMPPFLHMHGMAENAAMAQMMKTQSDELLSLYKQQLGVVDGHEKQQPSQQQHRKTSKDLSIASPSSSAVATVSPQTQLLSAAAVGGGSSSPCSLKQQASVPASALAAHALTAAAGECQVTGAIAEHALNKAAKVAAGGSAQSTAACATPPGNPVSPPPPQQSLASSSIVSGPAFQSTVPPSMSSASSTRSSMSSDGESFGEASTRHSPSTGLAAPLPTSTTGLSSSAQPSSSSSRKRSMRTLPTEQKDDAYWERRRKNNEAAKRSRDARRAKEDEIAIRAAFLEQENLRLRVDLAAARQEVEKLRAALVAQQTSKGSDIATS